MRLLVYSNLYPSDSMPRHGVFVEERLRQLLSTGRIDASVCALRPRVPFSRNAKCSDDLGTQVRNGIDVRYQRVPTAPLVTNWIDPLLWARASRRTVAALAGPAADDLVLDAHFLYPDGVAAVIIGLELGIPVVLTARGSDVNVKSGNPVMRRWIVWAMQHSAAVITVSADLASKLLLLGAEDAKIHSLPNGVDLEKFRPVDGRGVRAQHDLHGTVLLSVGHLIEGKGHHLVIEALATLPDVSLLIVGEGPERGRLEDLARKSGVASRVRFAGLVPHAEMSCVYSAADVTVLASSNEGMPNVVLESIACGTPVVATDVGGIPEVITAPSAGRVISARTATALARSIDDLLGATVDRAETRRFAQRYGWDNTVTRQLALYEGVLGS